MKIYKITFVALFCLLLPLSAFAQFSEAFSEENFSKQGPLTEQDVAAFLKSDAVYSYLNDDLQKNITLEQANAFVNEKLGISAERYIYVAAKLGLCYAVMYDRGVDEAAQQTMFASMPSYFGASASEQALIKKYKTQIAAMFAKFNG